MPGHYLSTELFEPAPIWEKLPHETSRAFGAFIVYRNLPAHKRSLRQAVITLHGDWSHSKQRMFQRWSAKYNWVSRASAWDEEVDRETRVIQIEAVKLMNERHVQVGKALQQKAIERLRAVTPEEMKLEDILAFLNTGVKFERQALGEPDEIVSVQKEEMLEIVDYSKMSTDQLKAMLARKLIEIGEPLNHAHVQEQIDVNE